ncbi:hypothetical protein [Dactylosporangium sp. CA-233914]|uniref:hypothetical protein n=1 Tax=Dactylosporangium sp. CA-233914 TaxID=3239934 RepID=UPI003D8AD08B
MTRPLSPGDLYDLRLPVDPQLSPDGERIAYTELELETLEKDACVVLRPEIGIYFPVVFYNLPDGSRYMRATPKVD